jgi:hypothetical protein
VLDALAHDGPGSLDRVRARAATLCSQVSFTSTPSQLLAVGGSGGAAFLAYATDPSGSLATGARYSTGEPLLADYATRSVLGITGPSSVQATDALPVTVELRDTGGQPLAGRQVVVTLGDRSASAATGADGVATVQVEADADAGPATVVAAFAGDEHHTASSATHAIEVLHEDTRLVWLGETPARGETVASPPG